jgi:hypothetical protein
MKIRPVGADLFHADGQTYMPKLTVAFRNFANAPKMHGTVFPLPPYTSMPCIGGNFTSTVLVSLLFYAFISKSAAQQCHTQSSHPFPILQ